MNYKFFTMNFIKTMKKFAPILVLLVFVVTFLNIGSYDPYNELAILTPDKAQATFSGSGLTVPTLSGVAALNMPTLPDLTLNESGFSSTTSNTSSNSNSSTSHTMQSCNVNASESTVVSGTNVTISWTTQGFSSVTLNGVSQTNLNGSKTFTNVQANTTYTLIAKSADGKSECTTSVTVLCVPPVVTPVCELDLQKSVSKTSAKPGDELTYTIKIKNIGTGDCTGGGVKIVDVVDANLTYLSETHTDNLNSGYASNPVYVASTRTLYWNGNVLTPGEEGIITWTGKVNPNLVCGTPVVVKNTAKATAAELSNFTAWTYSNTVETAVYESCPPVLVPTCDVFTAAPSTITRGNSAQLTWTTTNTNRVTINNGIGEVTATGTVMVAPTSTITYLLTAYRNSVSDTCSVTVTVNEPPVVPVPTCDVFTAAPSTITRGNSATLNWLTSNTNRVTINNGIGEVTATGTISVTPLATTEYLLTAFGANDQKNTCLVTLTVNEPPVVTVPKCESFTATPNSLPVGGGNVVLNWTTSNATAVSISPAVGTTTSLNGSTTVALTASTTFTLTASDAKGSTNTCAVAVVVTPPTPVKITCENSVNLKAEPSTINRGDSSTLTWTTTKLTSLSFDNGITATGFSGSTSVSPSVSTTYTLTGTDGKDTIKCPVTVTVNTSSGGGGGGGSSSPRCELSVSDNKINLGQKVVLKWDSSRATDLFIEDKTTDDIIVTTDKLTSRAKDRLLEGEITVSPKKDTTYTLTVKRGSSKRTCSVKVDVENNIVVTQVRDQQPLVAGISLSNVPYTGFEAGPILTLLFYTLLMAWALYVAYLVVIRRDPMGGVKFATNRPAELSFVAKSELIRPDVFVAKVQAPVMPISTLTPDNLPTGAPVVGYASTISTAENDTETDTAKTEVSTNVHNIDDAEVTRIENYAHAQRVLLSSDAIRHFIATTNNQSERLEALDQVIKTAKSQFPSEDGWVVLNEKRMKDTCVVCTVNSVRSSEAPYIPAVIPEGAGSLAEAIVTGNVVASYEMIGSRPMFALADAAADLDTIYRIRKGGTGSVSELLLKETSTLTNEQLLQIIAALTGALDGTYTDEASAVKMAIMKAIKVVA